MAEFNFTVARATAANSCKHDFAQNISFSSQKKTALKQDHKHFWTWEELRLYDGVPRDVTLLTLINAGVWNLWLASQIWLFFAVSSSETNNVFHIISENFYYKLTQKEPMNQPNRKLLHITPCSTKRKYLHFCKGAPSGWRKFHRKATRYSSMISNSITKLLKFIQSGLGGERDLNRPTLIGQPTLPSEPQYQLLKKIK